MALVAAVSGGVDSVVMLHMLIQKQKSDIIVAHFDHGIRPESDADARFVSGLAGQYGLTFELCREELGPSASEELARTRRYAFLRELAKKYDASIATAHHADDVVETVAINLTRGTGWRGLAVLDTDNIVRPLSGVTKDQIYEYATRHALEWVEDETNASDVYLRNRMRQKIRRQAESLQMENVLALWHKQKLLKREIDTQVAAHIGGKRRHSRYFFTHIDDTVAYELLREMTAARLTRPQLQVMLHAIKTARHGAKIEVGAGITLHITTRQFIVETPQ